MESIAQHRTIAEQVTKPPYATKWGQRQTLGKRREKSNVGKQRQDGMTRQRCLYKGEETATESKSARESSRELGESERTETNGRDYGIENENERHLEHPCDLHTETYNLFTTLIEEISFLIIFIVFIFVRLCSQLLLLLIPLQTLDSST